MLITATGPRDWRKFFYQDLVVTLNGEIMKDVGEADDETGYVVRYVRGADGKVATEPVGRFNRSLTERLEGTVVFTGTKRYSPGDAKTASQAKRARRQSRNLTIQNRTEVRAGRRCTMRYTAIFSNGFTVTRARQGAVTHAWHATGRLKNGRAWSMNGFSTIGAEQAAVNMHTDTRHIDRQGGVILFSEVVAVTQVTELVPA
jgi:hypothetical protein